MPKMSGKLLAEKIYQFNPKLRFLFLSGYSDQTLSILEVPTNSIFFLEKPFKTKDLIIKIRKILDN